MLPSYLIRTIDDSDVNFIISTWTKVHHLAPTVTDIPQAIYLPEQTKIIERLLQRSTTLIACYPEEPSRILGYLTYQLKHPDIVMHWAHIKEPYRKQGLLHSLLSYVNPLYPQHLVLVTHPSPNITTYKREQPPFVYNPYLTQEVL